MPQIYDWPERWKVMQAHLDCDDIDWMIFRRDQLLMQHIQSVRRNDYLQQWTRCEEESVPLAMREDSLVGDPVGWTRRGIFVTATSLIMARRLSRILSSWIPPRSLRVLEIGGGFGAMARTVLTHLHVQSYTMIDGPPCLEIQRHYLYTTCPDASVKFIPCDEMQGKMSYVHINGLFDLIININSFSEMTTNEVKDYFILIHGTLLPGGLLYSYNKNRLNRDGAEPDVPFSAFPFDDRWKIISKLIPPDAPLWLEVAAMRTS